MTAVFGSSPLYWELMMQTRLDLSCSMLLDLSIKCVLLVLYSERVLMIYIVCSFDILINMFYISFEIMHQVSGEVDSSILISVILFPTSRSIVC